MWVRGRTLISFNLRGALEGELARGEGTARPMRERSNRHTRTRVHGNMVRLVAFFTLLCTPGVRFEHAIRRREKVDSNWTLVILSTCQLVGVGDELMRMVC